MVSLVSWVLTGGLAGLAAGRQDPLQLGEAFDLVGKTVSGGPGGVSTGIHYESAFVSVSDGLFDCFLTHRIAKLFKLEF